MTMPTKNVWLVGFLLSFLSLIAAIAFRLGWLQPLSYSQYRTKNLYNEFTTELKGQMVPNFQVNTQNEDTLGVFALVQTDKSLVLFLGPGCAPCDDRTIEILTEFEKTKAHKIGLDIIALVFRYENEFVHLRKLTNYNFAGKIAKFNSINTFSIPRYPALYLLEKNSRRVLDVFFPHAGAEKELQDFLNNLTNSRFLNSTLPGRATQHLASGGRVSSFKNSETVDTPKAKLITQKENSQNLVFHKRLQLEHKIDDDLLSEIMAFSVGINGEMFFSHSLGTKITLFDNNGKYITSITGEDVFGPGSKNVRCRRILPLDETRVCLLYSGFVNDLTIFDWKSKKVSFISLKDKNERRTHPVVDMAAVNDRIYLLSHPQRALGYFSEFPKVIELDLEGKQHNDFTAFPDFKFPNLSQHLALDRDQILCSGKIIYTSSPLGDRIYRFDLSGNRLNDLIYPKDAIVQLDHDAPDDYRQWNKYFSQFGKIDLLNEIFCLRKDNAENVIVVRQRDRHLYFDLFSETGVLTYLGEYTDYFEGFRIANRENLFYGYKWPELTNDQFVAYGNPEIVVYRLDL